VAVVGGMATRWWLWDCYSVGQATFVRVVESGPFAFVRHPLAAFHCVGRLALLAAWPSAANLLLAVVSIGLGVASVLIEERFLLARPAYAHYAIRVRSRLVPGIW
jgi:protein-S-isoprenylcysteine O-methyltransferase Ste14